MSTLKTITRRGLLTTAGAVASSLALPAIKRAGAAEQIVVADVGGAPAEALRKAFYDPFEKATGI
ncbi:MAG: ABC transporter substrate-binding protein, partial [Alphaproteobacteria bacterium]|nr:ABC transporter substrate-binding protein [Alphaproteobacteria bacterium]